MFWLCEQLRAGGHRRPSTGIEAATLVSYHLNGFSRGRGRIVWALVVTAGVMSHDLHVTLEAYPYKVR